MRPVPTRLSGDLKNIGEKSGGNRGDAEEQR